MQKRAGAQRSRERLSHADPHAGGGNTRTDPKDCALPNDDPGGDLVSSGEPYGRAKPGTATDGDPGGNRTTGAHGDTSTKTRVLRNLNPAPSRAPGPTKAFDSTQTSGPTTARARIVASGATSAIRWMRAPSGLTRQFSKPKEKVRAPPRPERGGPFRHG